MNITVSKEQGRVPVTVLKVDGQLDGQNYQELIAKARRNMRCRRANDAAGSGRSHLYLQRRAGRPAHDRAAAAGRNSAGP